jgi:hypothetical protein
MKLAMIHCDKVEDNGLIHVCANVLLYHHCDLGCSENEELYRCWLQKHVHRSWSKHHVRKSDGLSEDILSPEYVDHCFYHEHGINGICYKQNSSDPRLDQHQVSLLLLNDWQKLSSLPGNLLSFHLLPTVLKAHSRGLLTPVWNMHVVSHSI